MSVGARGEVGLRSIVTTMALLGCAPGPGIRGAAVAFDTRAPAVARVVVEERGEADGELWIEWGLEGALDQSTDAARTEEGWEARLIGLKAGRRYGWRPVLERADGTRQRGLIRFLDAPALPDELPPFERTAVDPTRSEVDDGWLLANVYDKDHSFVVIVDGDGDVVWWLPDDGPPYKINRTRPSLDGASVLRSQYDGDREQDLGVIERFALDGSAWTVTQAEQQHHDFVEHPDGSLAWLSWGYLDRPLVGFGEGVTAYDIVREAPEGAARDEADEVFDLAEAYPEEPKWLCVHNSEGQFVPDAWEWSHSNSLVHDAARDRWYVQARYLDALIAIDRPTGRLEWVMGGDVSDFTLVGSGTPALHGHLSDVGVDSVIVFDNQDHGTGVSRVVEYTFDEEARTYEQVWEHVDPEGRFTSFLGDAKRLPGGNRLVAWSPHGEVEEVTWEGDVVWALRHDFVVGRVTPLARGANSRSSRR